MEGQSKEATDPQGDGALSSPGGWRPKEAWEKPQNQKQGEGKAGVRGSVSRKKTAWPRRLKGWGFPE